MVCYDQVIVSDLEGIADRADLNDLRYPREDSIRSTRLFWLQTGLHPPASDLCEI